MSNIRTLLLVIKQHRVVGLPLLQGSMATMAVVLERNLFWDITALIFTTLHAVIHIPFCQRNARAGFKERWLMCLKGV